MATKNERNFTEEQILAGRNSQISLQAGSNKGASQVDKIENCEITKLFPDFPQNFLFFSVSVPSHYFGIVLIF